MELRGLCGRRAEPPIQTDTSNKTVREGRGVLQDRSFKNEFLKTHRK